MATSIAAPESDGPIAGRRAARYRGRRCDRRSRLRHGGRLGAPAAPAGPPPVLHRFDPTERLLGLLPVSHERTNRLAMSSIRIAPHGLKKPTREETESRHE